MTPLDYIFWAAEFALEGFGADYAFKRKIWPLFAYLIFRFWADFIGFIVFFAYGQNTFYWFDFYQRAIQFPLMVFMLVWVIGNVLKDDSRTIKIYAAILPFLGLILALGWQAMVLLNVRNIFKITIAANMFMCSALCLGMAMRKEVKSPWGAISAGILIQVGSEAVLTLGLLKGLDTSKLYPLGAIAALGMWFWAVRPKYQLKEARLNLGVR